MATLRHIYPALLALLVPLRLSADPGIDFFEKEVRPVLVEHCYECHSADAKKLRGSLFLDSRIGWQQGGDSGPALRPGEVDESLIIRAVRYAEEDIEMPPKQKMPQAAIDVLTKWVAMGAPDPRDEAPVSAEVAGIDLDEGRQFWSFQPLAETAIPAAPGDWPINPIDHFIAARLAGQNLSPTADADPASLLRRIYIDLTGLPPSVEAVEKFITRFESEKPDKATKVKIVDEVVQSLISSRSFGERWGRHWLDLARYADSTGGGASKLLPDAYKYRDSIIDAFNENLPYDQLIRRQLAGDHLSADDSDERYANLVATGFLVLGPRNYINDDEEAFRMDGADEQLDTVGRVFLGMTVGCARCHDHKFDPVPMADYYALAGIFTSTETYDNIPTTTNFEWNDIGDPRVDPDGSLLAKYEAANAVYRARTKQWARARNDPDFDTEKLKALAAERLALKEALPEKPAVVMGAVDAPQPDDEERRIRGNPHQLAEKVPRGFLRVTFADDTTAPDIPTSRSGRLELAEWIASPQNPLTARVYVNRVWAHLMGRGIVSSVDNFGITGVAPTHPQLLDWLAKWFLDNGQSTKKLVALIVSSRTYQLGSADENSPLLTGDPANELFGRRHRRSLDAETIRDSILKVSGVLDTKKSDRPFPAKLKTELEYDFDADHRRSVYLPRFRNNLPEIFETFDVANPATVVGRRDLTILSPQALYLMNNAFITEQSKTAATALLAKNLSTEAAVRHAFLSTLGREPSKDEQKLAIEFLGIDNSPDRWTAFQQNLFACVDFRFLR